MRYKLVFTIFLSFFLILVFFLFKIQVIEHSQHKEFINSLMQKTILTKGNRGTIFDRNGFKIAWSKKIPYIEYNSNIDIESLKPYLTDKQILDLISSGKAYLDNYQIYELEKLGLYIHYEEKRFYVPEAFHIVGYVNSQGIGSSGIEKTYDSLLQGKIGSELIFSSPSGKVKQRIIQTEPENGEDITLTLDLNLQKYIYDEMKKINNPGAVIVENVKNGEILALVSYPNLEENFYDIDKFTWQKIVNDPSNPLLNRATMGLYSPGSAIKPLIAIAYLLSESTSATLNCTGRYEYKSSSGKTIAIFNDWLLSGHEETDLIKALRVSCNVYFYTIALEIGIDKIKSVADIFKISDLTKIDIEEKSGIFPSREWKEKQFKTIWYPGDTILTGIGQGYILLTPLEILNFYTTIANNGKTPRPHLLKSEKVEYTNEVSLPDKIWSTIKEGLLEVTTYNDGTLKNRGTAYLSFKDAPYKIAGKTGTAEVSKSKKAHSWFAGFGPIEDPTYSVVVMFENGGSGSEMAAPFARKVFDYLLKGVESNE
ncbi:penicillin-binding protein 2 [Thermosipho africanus H17ap60334]|uniref:penicillin-binding transpeptidase domain-containing protein n=1 Tax=Thermosipho africanus TaxID=2421 RepID=UPI00028E9D69|nr:penicillin-binding transpeptidase domain-containing protein [Thermosipho africanus]EKF49563.1 penicillin-binding protein 2 [Thermosipho africanus H17ap60334]RDI91689.1 penicillin-binding protein 2 [Thermosipho africanus Ob7]